MILSASVKKLEDQLLLRFRYLSGSKKKEALDFMGYLMAKEKWGSNLDVLADKELLKNFKEGLHDLQEGKVSPVEL